MQLNAHAHTCTIYICITSTSVPALVTKINFVLLLHINSKVDHTLGNMSNEAYTSFPCAEIHCIFTNKLVCSIQIQQLIWFINGYTFTNA